VAFVLRVFDHLGEFVIQTPFRNASWTFVCYNGAMTTTELSRFFRKKHNTQQVLAQFALTARDETDLDALLAELTRVVDETLQPGASRSARAGRLPRASNHGNDFFVGYQFRIRMGLHGLANGPMCCLEAGAASCIVKKLGRGWHGHHEHCGPNGHSGRCFDSAIRLHYSDCGCE